MLYNVPPPPEPPAPIVVELTAFRPHTGKVHRLTWAHPATWRPAAPSDPIVVDEYGVIDESEPYETGLITEDDPRWDCRTMGNRACGTDDGKIIVHDESGSPVWTWSRDEWLVRMGQGRPALPESVG